MRIIATTVFIKISIIVAIITIFLVGIFTNSEEEIYRIVDGKVYMLMLQSPKEKEVYLYFSNDSTFAEIHKQQDSDNINYSFVVFEDFYDSNQLSFYLNSTNDSITIVCDCIKFVQSNKIVINFPQSTNVNENTEQKEILGKRYGQYYTISGTTLYHMQNGTGSIIEPLKK